MRREDAYLLTPCVCGRRLFQIRGEPSLGPICELCLCRYARCRCDYPTVEGSAPPLMETSNPAVRFAAYYIGSYVPTALCPYRRSLLYLNNKPQPGSAPDYIDVVIGPMHGVEYVRSGHIYCAMCGHERYTVDVIFCDDTDCDCQCEVYPTVMSEQALPTLETVQRAGWAYA